MAAKRFLLFLLLFSMMVSGSAQSFDFKGLTEGKTVQCLKASLFGVLFATDNAWLSIQVDENNKAVCIRPVMTISRHQEFNWRTGKFAVLSVAVVIVWIMIEDASYHFL